MTMKVKAVEKLLKFDKNSAGVYRYVMSPELANTAVQITCYDRNGEEVRRVTSTDDGTVEDNEGTNENENQNGGGSSNTNGTNGGGTNTGGGTSTVTPSNGGGDNNGDNGGDGGMDQN
jgi:hypothetical protein